MTIRPAQRRAAVAAFALAVAVAVGLVACAAPDAPSSGTATTTTVRQSTTTTTLAGGGSGGSSTTTTALGGSTTTVLGGGSGSTTTLAPGGSSTTVAPTTTTTVPTTTTTWPTADVTVSPAVPSVATNPGYGFVKVYWNNQRPNQLVFIDICSVPSSTPGFTPGLNCAPLSELNVNGTPSGKGVADLLVFRGAEPSGDLRWGCFAPSDTAPAGILKLTTCYVRVTTGSLANNADAKEAPFTIR